MIELKIKSTVEMKSISFNMEGHNLSKGLANINIKAKIHPLNLNAPYDPEIMFQIPMPTEILKSIVDYCEKEMGISIKEREGK